MRPVVLAILGVSLAIGGCSHPYAKPQPAPLAQAKKASSVKPRVIRAKAVREARFPVPTLSQASKVNRMEPPRLPVSEFPEAQSEAPSASVAPSTTAGHYLVLDTVGNCSVIDAKPNGGLKIVGEKGGYASKDAANKAMKDEAKCKGVETGAVEQDAEFKLKAAEAKVRKLGGVHKLTQEDIDGLSYDQIKQLRGY
jgi:hypothetical protein